MKKLNITKEQFNRSNYFQRKYGKLKYVSESGRLYKTNKGKVLKFINESKDFDASDALANELGIDSENDIWINDSAGYDYYEPDYTFGVKLPDGDEATYLVYDNEESAKTGAADDLGERFEDDPPILGAAIDYFGFSVFKAYVNGLDEDELEDLENLKDEMHQEEFASYIQSNIGVDFRGFAEYNIEQLGPAWHIASYDGNEIELANGMLAYRVD